KYVQEALTYITEHYNEPDISVKSIAESLGLSDGHLSHIFKKETDYTINACITRYRIQMAMKLLKDVRIKVYEVAEMVGYKDITYFSSTFKKVAGVSPSEYQEKR
nr:AraC family transcriptional regulator [Lachnospiraceae bacterium]